jgi:hypothetical protein
LSALYDVWLEGVDRFRYAHASIQATLHNAHFETDKVPWFVDDFLGIGNREERMRERKREKAMAFKFSAVMTSDLDLMPEFMSHLVSSKVQ